jgi:hypothetical protein
MILIRSAKNDRFSTNIDILCAGVRYICLPTIMRTLVLDEADFADVERLSDQLNIKISYPDVVWQFETETGRYFLVGVGLTVTENGGDMFAKVF